MKKAAKQRWTVEEDLIARLFWSKASRVIWGQQLSGSKKGTVEDVIRLLFTDRAFRKRALSGRKAAERLGFAFRKGLKLKVVENTADTLHVVLPALMSQSEYEATFAKMDLRDEQLTSAVSAGFFLGAFQDNFDKTRHGDGKDKQKDVDPYREKNGEYNMRDRKITGDTRIIPADPGGKD